MEFDKTWQEVITQHPPPSLILFLVCVDVGRSVNKDGRPGLSYV